jgi:hypothetical protein
MSKPVSTTHWLTDIAKLYQITISHPVRFEHCRSDGIFIYARAAGPNIAYAMGHEFTRPPLAHSKVAIYTWSQTTPAFVGRLSRIVKHWKDCVDIAVTPSPHHSEFTGRYILRIPSYWYEFSSLQSVFNQVCLRLCKPSCGLYDFTNTFPIYLASPSRDKPYSANPPHSIILVPHFQYSPQSSPYYNVKVLD